MNALQQAQFAPNYGGFQQAQIPQFTNQGMPGQNSNMMSMWSTPQVNNGFSIPGPNSMAISTNNLSSIQSQNPQINTGFSNGFSFQGPNSMDISTNNLSSILPMNSPVEQAIMLFERLVNALSRLLEQIIPGGLAGLLGIGGAGAAGGGTQGVGGMPGVGSQMPIGQGSTAQPNLEAPRETTTTNGEREVGFTELLSTWGQFLRNEEAVDAALTAAGNIPIIGGALDSSVARWGAGLLGDAIGWFF